IRANQLFVTGHKGSLEEGLRDIKARVLLLPAVSDLLLFPQQSREAMDILKKQGRDVAYVEIPGDGGHLDGVLAITTVGEQVRNFLSR
ncbi:MAG: E22 family MetX-like putative esterase, partial [Candidatus Rokuibacteriota bacterium]